MGNEDCLYPNLNRYLRGTRKLDAMYDPRRSDSWLSWVAMVSGIWVFVTFGWLWWLLFLAPCFMLSRWRMIRRLNGKSMPQALAEAARERLPSKIQVLARTGKLAATIGETGAAALERCAALAVRAQGDLARACALLADSGSRKELRKDILDAVSATMSHAFAAFEKRLLSPTSLPPTDILMVVEAERELELLASAVAAWAQSVRVGSTAQPEYARIRERLRLMREFRFEAVVCSADTVHGSSIPPNHLVT
ncbi:MAG: hypothetical protein ACYC96_06545 [Fimbriimonadaceae bacterium]